MATRPDAELTPERRSALVKQRARELGFHAVGITDLSPPPHADALTAWLERGMAGDMHYMSRQADRRRNPALILPGANRVVVLTRHYDPTDPPDPGPGYGRVAKYARGVDYHTWIRDLLNELSRVIVAMGDEHTVARSYVDAGPVPERELAQRAGIGWIGKNTMLIDPGRGSYSYVAVILTNLDIAPDQPFEADRCGTCRRCIDACPTGAIVDARVLDARRCISYLTIEQRGEPDADVASLAGNWVFGCDACQDVCPWNVAFASTGPDVTPSDPNLAYLDLASLIAIDQKTFDDQFGATALTRADASGLRRNAATVQENERLRH